MKIPFDEKGDFFYDLIENNIIKEKSPYMNNYRTNNEIFPLNKISINKFFIGILEKVINDLLNNELSLYLDIEKNE